MSNGSSNSTALVAGAAALIRSKYPDLSAPDVVHRLTATATDKGPPGRDDQYGYGVLNLVAALTADVAPATPSAVPSTAVQPSTGQGDGFDGAGFLRNMLPFLAGGLLIFPVLVGVVVITSRRRK
jgi:subtilisin family serine protease